jgi:hypothetical protein
MATMLGSLLVSLGLESAQFKRDLKQTEKQVTLFGKNIKIGMAAVGAAAVAAAGALAMMVKSSIDTADEISKAAQKVGIGTEELSRLRYAADMSGVSFDGLQTSVSKLNRNMVAAAAGTASAQAGFAALGVSVTKSDGTLRSSTDVMGDVADRFAKMDDGAQKSAIAMQIFGKSGADMIPMLNGGRAALEELTSEADKFGIVIDTETGRKAEAFNDNISRLQGVLSSLATRIAADLLPHLVNMTDWLVKNQSAIVSVTKSVGEFFVGLGRVIGMVVNAARALNQTFSPAVEWAKRNLGALYQVASAMLNPLGTAISYIQRLGKTNVQGVGPMAFGMVNDLIRDATAVSSSFATSMDTVAASSGKAGKALKSSLGAGAKSAKDEMQSAMDTLAAFKKEMQAAGLFNGPSADATRQIRADDGPVQQDMARIGGGLDELTAKLKETAEKANVANVQIAQSFADMAQNTLNALDRVASAIKGGGFLEILSSVIGLGLQLGSAGLFGKSIATTLNTPRVPGFANGTRFAPGGLAMVGERGRELVNLPRGSQVIPNRELSGMSGGGIAQIVPSPYFDVVVDGRIVSAAPSIMNGGSKIAQSEMARTQNRMLR